MQFVCAQTGSERPSLTSGRDKQQMKQRARSIVVVRQRLRLWSPKASVLKQRGLVQILDHLAAPGPLSLAPSSCVTGSWPCGVFPSANRGFLLRRCAVAEKDAEADTSGACNIARQRRRDTPQSRASKSREETNVTDRRSGIDVLANS